jgi:cytochrome c oxidase cbb3-type subunit 3
MPISKQWVRGSAGVVAAALALAACRGGEDKTAADSATAAGGGAAKVGTTSGDAIDQYEGVPKIAQRAFNGDQQAAVAGRQSFIKYNCYGCHGGLAGGAMGPSLRDDEWKYGGTDEAILASLHQGRPAGMPAWKGVASEEELRNMVVYIRSLRSPAEPTFFFAVGDTTTKTEAAYR